MSPSGGAALLKCKQLLSTESLVVDLRCCFDQVLKMGAGKEVSEVNKFAVVLVLDIDNPPAVLTSTDLFTTNYDGLLRSDNGKWDYVLIILLVEYHTTRWQTNLDLSIQSSLLLIKFIIIVWEHLQVVESKLLLYALFECASLLEG
jgi:hypothetical protein